MYEYYLVKTEKNCLPLILGESLNFVKILNTNELLKITEKLNRRPNFHCLILIIIYVTERLKIIRCMKTIGTRK